MRKLIFFIVILPILLGGCTDELLTQHNPNQLSEGNFWASPSDAELGLMGAYSALQSADLFNSDPWAGGALRLDYISDDGYAVWGWMPLAAVAEANLTSTSWGNPEFFRAAYDAIMRSNRVIENVPEIEEMDPADADRIVAEAKVIRSTAYLQLAMTYGNVPLVTEALPVQEADVPKSSRDEVFAFIVQDLGEAAPHLPPSVDASEWGRLPRGAAYGMQARAYLYHGDYTEAAAAAKEVIDLQVHSLFPDYGALFTVENEINDEVIFPVTFERGQGGEGSNFAGYWGNGPVDYQRPLPDLARAYYCTDGLPPSESAACVDSSSVNRDPRFGATLVGNGEEWRGEIMEGRDTYFMRKWAEEDNNLDHFDSPQDWYVLRYADVLLMRAEALARSGGSESEIVSLVNEVRDRVDMPHVEDVEGTGLSPQELIDIVKHERRVELAFEGLRYFDIKRWGEIEEAYAEYNENTHNNYGPSMPEREWQPRFEYWPLPQGEVDANDNLDQNDDY